MNSNRNHITKCERCGYEEQHAGLSHDLAICQNCLQPKEKPMTEHAAPQRAGVSHPHDKHGHPVKKGQLVEFVWAGEHHKGLVEEVSTDDHGTHRAHITITAVVPCTATSVREDENPKGAEKDGSKVTHRKETK